MDVRSLRESLGLNQAEFARVVGYTQGTVSRWETGEVKVSPRLAEYLRLKIDAHRAARPESVSA
jgi:DNA-binding transcriptional regulator YiaG